MKQRFGWLYGGFVALLMVFLGTHITTSTHHCAEKEAIATSVIMDANHERNYLSERSVNTALIPEVSHSLAPTNSRTISGRQRTSASYQSHTPAPNISATNGIQAMASRATHCGYLQTSRTKDFYVFALRHIII